MDLDLLALELCAVELSDGLLGDILVVVLDEGLAETLSIGGGLQLAREDGAAGLINVEEVENLLLGHGLLDALDVHIGVLVVLGLGLGADHG